MCDRSKVYWCENERATIVCRAADLVEQQPHLAGIHLLREAIKTLPAGRQRTIAALTWAPWFTGALEVERRRRVLQERVSADAAAAIREQIDWMQSWSSGQLQRLDRMLSAIDRVACPERMRLQAEAQAEVKKFAETWYATIEERVRPAFEKNALLLEELHADHVAAQASYREFRAQVMEMSRAILFLLQILMGLVITPRVVTPVVNSARLPNPN